MSSVVLVESSVVPDESTVVNTSAVPVENIVVNATGG